MNTNGHPSTLIPNGAGKTTTPVRELRDMQRVAYKLIMEEGTKPSDVAQLMRAHVAAGQHRCELLMRPKPRPADVPYKARNTKALRRDDSAYSDPTGPAA